jgi:D-glycero-alpha-D-manno-heptose-7-phosphate kinase
VDELARLVGEHWEWQRALHPAITTPRIEAIIDAGRRAGALGAKALGASGGGCVLVVASEDAAEPVRDTVATLGEVLPFAVDVGGFTVESVAP